MSLEKKKQTLETLAADYVTWQQRIEALEAERPGVHGLVMRLQQESMEGEIDRQVLQRAKEDLQDLDQRLEAGGLGLKDLWHRMEEAVMADFEARYQAAPETKAALDQECKKKCELAAALLAQAMSLFDNLNINPKSLAKSLGLGGEDSLVFATSMNSILMEAYHKVKREPLTPKSPEWPDTYRTKKNDLMNFLVSWQGNRSSLIRREINAAIQAAGGAPRPGPQPYFGTREARYVGKDI